MFPLWVTAVKRAQDYPHHSPEFAIPPVILIGGLVLLLVSKSVTSMPMRSSGEFKRVSDTVFFSDLLSPCSDDLPPISSTAPPSASFAVDYIRILRERTSACIDHATSLLSTNLPQNCSMHHAIMEVPQQDTLQAMTQAEALSTLYRFLLTHTAYAHFIHEQVLDYENTSCQSGRPNEDTLRENSKTLAAQLRDLLCTIKLTSAVHGGNVQFRQAEEDVAGLNVYDEDTCSRRVLRDCQVVASIINILRTFHTYLQNEEAPHVRDS